MTLLRLTSFARGLWRLKRLRRVKFEWYDPPSPKKASAGKAGQCYEYRVTFATFSSQNEAYKFGALRVEPVGN